MAIIILTNIIYNFKTDIIENSMYRYEQIYNNQSIIRN